MNRIPNGARVTVRHLMSDAEEGIVVGSTNPATGETITYTVEFADRTRSTWPASAVSPMNVKVTVRRLIGAGQWETRTRVVTPDVWETMRDSAARCSGEVTTEPTAENPSA